MPSTSGQDSPDIAHFRAIPWCAAHLNKPNLVIEEADGRQVKPRYEDALFSQALKTSDTIPAFITFYPNPADPKGLVNEIRGFLTLGPLVSGHPEISHGGIVMTVLDEMMGFLAPLNRRRGAIRGPPLVTAYLNTTFVRPVRTPGTILATAWFKKIEGTKYYIEGRLEDEDGKVLAKAEALFVGWKQNL